MMEKMLTVRDVAEILGVTEQTVRTYILQQRLEASVLGNKYRLTEQGVKDFLYGVTIQKKYDEAPSKRVSEPETDEPEEPEDGVTVV